MKDVVDLGSFVYNDEDSDVVIELKDDFGVAYPFTGATLIKLVCQPIQGGTAIEVTGSIYSIPNGQLLFAKVAQALTDPGPRGRQTYRCLPRWLKSGGVLTSFSRTEFRLTVERFPV